MVMFKINDTHTLISEFSSYNFQVLLFSSKHCQTYSCYIIQVLNTFLYYKCCKINHSFTYIQLHKRNDLLYFSPRNIKTVVSLHSFLNEKKKRKFLNLIIFIYYKRMLATGSTHAWATGDINSILQISSIWMIGFSIQYASAEVN